jgi:uncharacterized repeat protein (TIGR01451 family)
MSNLLSTISGQFTKSFILGAFFPAVVFVILNLVLVLPFLPSGLSPVEILKDFDKEWQAATALFAAIVASGLLYGLNVPLIRLYEGYLFEDIWLGRRMRKRQAKKLASMEEEIEQLRAAYYDMDADDEGHDEVERKLTLLWSERRLRFPRGETFLAPTALGNVIAAFEHYAHDQYGIDAVVLWPRLIGIIDGSFAGAIDDAKTSFDFFVNSSFLLVVLTLGYLSASLYTRTSLSSIPSALVSLGVVVVLGTLAWLAYRASIDSAIGWGDLVKSAFDLYRSDLLAKLGYETDLTNAQEFDLWQQISQGMIFRRPEAPPPPYKKPESPATRVEPDSQELHNIEWAISKGVEGPIRSTTGAGPLQAIKYVLTVTNETDQRVEDVTLIDTVPSGFEYIVGSAELRKSERIEEIEATGTNPYRWKLGDISAGQSATITYRVLLRPDAVQGPHRS